MQASAVSNASGLTFNGVVVKAPKEKGCKVFEDVEATKTKGAEGVIKTHAVKGHTSVVEDTEAGVKKERHSVIIEPTEGTIFATFFIECKKGEGVPEALEGTWTIEGKIQCPTQGATIVCNHETITTANTLKGKGAKAGLAGKATITAGAGVEPPLGETHPISVTTTAN